MVLEGALVVLAAHGGAPLSNQGPNHHLIVVLGHGFLHGALPAVRSRRQGTIRVAAAPLYDPGAALPNRGGGTIGYTAPPVSLVHPL
jgi:hypothetical protein